MSKQIHNPASIESPLWKGRPSQWVNLPGTIWCVLKCCVILYSLQFSEVVLGYINKAEYEIYWYGFVVFLCGVFGGVLIYRILSIAYTKYELTNEKLMLYSGITKMFQHGSPLELYDVIDYELPPPGFLVFVGRSTLILETVDTSHKRVYLYAIKDSNHVYEIIRQNVQKMRMDKKAYHNATN